MLDLRVEFLLKAPFNSNGGSNYKIKWLTLPKDNILHIPRYKKNDKDAGYALIFVTHEDVESLWSTEAQFMEVKIHGKHAFSGITKSFSQKYYTKKNCIRSGLFNFGKNFEIS